MTSSSRVTWPGAGVAPPTTAAETLELYQRQQKVQMCRENIKVYLNFPLTQDQKQNCFFGSCGFGPGVTGLFGFQLMWFFMKSRQCCSIVVVVVVVHNCWRPVADATSDYIVMLTEPLIRTFDQKCSCFNQAWISACRRQNQWKSKTWTVSGPRAATETRGCIINLSCQPAPRCCRTLQIHNYS